MRAWIRMVSKIVPAMAIAAVAAQPALAQVPEGAARDRKGEPYRIDSESGFRIKDHIADLEVQVDDLQRQVRALENELSEKQTIIDRLSNGESAKPELKERSLDVSTIARRSSDTAVDSSCRAIVVPLNKRIDRLENELQLARQSAEGARPGAAQEPAALQTENNKLRMQVARLQEALMSSPSKESFAREQDRRVKHEAALSDLRKLLQVSEEKQRAADARLAELTQQADQYKEQLARSGREADELKTRLASLEAEGAQGLHARARVKNSPVARVQAPEKTAGDPAALRQARSRLQTQLASIQRLIGQRKDKLDSVKHSRSGVSIRISPLKSSNNTSLDALRLKVKRLEYPEQEYQISTQLKEIEQVLLADIGVLSRLSSM